MREFKLNGMDAWIIPSKHEVECQKLKDNYSLSLKSMNKTISPFLVKLTMTYKIKFASVFVTWDVIWILVSSTFFSNLHMVRIIYIYIYVYTNMWDDKVPVLMDLECSGTLGSLMSFSCGSLLEGRNSICCPVYVII